VQAVISITSKLMKQSFTSCRLSWRLFIEGNDWQTVN